ncbi:MAG: fructose transport system permease protein [Actinomycetota bacterium]|jgi:fructose transport system permease protein|nr:fructose transport system permease protein [Actinomycetota bacterium]
MSILKSGATTDRGNRALERLPQFGRAAVGNPIAGPLGALALAMIFFSLQSGQFLQGPNLSLILQQVVEVGVLAIGQTLIILTAGIDLSCGAVMAFGMIVMTKLAVHSGVPAIPAILLGILACAAFGLVNGLFVTKVRLPAFIVTLGTFNIAMALVHIYSNEETIANPPSAMTYFGRTFSIGGTDITYAVVLMLALYALFWFVLTQTTWGNHIYAVGNNPEATRLSGIRTDRLLISVYVVAGAIYGLAALLLIARTEVGDPNAGQTDNLDSITAVVLGGTSLFGGRGAVIGTLFGALIVGVFRNGLVLMGVSSVYQILITGILVILAVSVDQLTHRKERG